MKLRLILSLFFAACIVSAVAQDTLSLDQARQTARKNYPQLKDLDLIRQSVDLSVGSLNRNWLPQLSVNGQATTQSDVTSLPIKLPGITVEALDKDQYRITGEVSQVLYDGGNVSRMKTIQRMNGVVETEKTEADLHLLDQRVNQYFLAILSTDELLKQNTLNQNDIDANVKKVDAMVKNGAAFRSNLATMQAEAIRNKQRRTELTATRASLIHALSLLLQTDLNPAVQLTEPEVEESADTNIKDRHELRLFHAQDSLLHAQLRLSNAKTLPRFSAFFQGGYGKPGLNMLDNEFKTFYITGVRMTWSLGGLYTLGRDRSLNHTQQARVQVQKELFELNTNIALRQQQENIAKYKTLLADDDELIRLRDEIKAASSAQLENGVITAADYLRELDAADQARIACIQHRIQLKEAQLNYLNLLGR